MGDDEGKFIVNRKLHWLRTKRNFKISGLFVSILLAILISFTFVSNVKASITPINPDNISHPEEFTEEKEPTFILDANGLARSSEPETNKGELIVGSTKIGAEVTWNEQAVDTLPTISAKDQSDQFEIKVSDNQFKPGLYQLKVNIDTENKDQTLTQDFTWGVLAINFNQSTYKVDEKATIGIGVLDNHGVTECAAKLKLTITSPDDQTTVLSTADNSIIVSKTCHNGNVTNEFDYAGTYVPKVEGKYQIKLEAETTNGKRGTEGTFEVNNDPDFVVRRLDTSMRIFPESPYRVNVAVQAFQPVNGQIKEKVPASFGVSDISAGGEIIDKTDDSQTIAWPVAINSGEEIQLSYTYDAPDISPEFYLLGPLEIRQATTEMEGEATGVINQTKIFTEPRAWQIATDATACSSSTTTGTMNWGTSTTWASPCDVAGGPTANNDVTITNTAKVITVEASTTREANSITFTGGTSVTTIQLSTSGGAVLNVLGTGAGGYGIQINSTGNGGTKTVAVAQNTLSSTSIRLVGGSSTKVAQVTLSTGTINVTAGGVTYSGTASNNKITFSGAGTINLTGDFLPGAFTCSTGKINANGSGAQSLGAFTYYNLDITNTAGVGTDVTFAGNVTIGGALNINDGNLDFAARTTTVTGATTVASGAYAVFSSATGTKTFNDDVTVSGIWNESDLAIAFAFAGNLTNNASSWTAGTGAHTFSGAGKTISGSTVTSIPSLTINGATGNSGTLTVSTALAGSNTLTNNNGATLNIGAATASMTISRLNASAATNTVNYNGTAGQTVKGITYHHLTIAKTAQTATLDGAIICNGDLTITSGILDTSGTNYAISVAGNWANSGTFNPNSGTVTLTGAGASTQEISGYSTFYNLTAQAANARTLKFESTKTQAITNTLDIDGSVDQRITLTTITGTTQWKINPTNATTITYVDVNYSNNIGASLCAAYSQSTNDNNTAWGVSAGASCNTAPNVPSSLLQKKVTGGATLATGDWTNETQVEFTATASDTDNPDTLYLCVEKDAITTALSSTNGGDLCGSGVAYSGTPVTVSVTITGLTDATEFHWQAQVKDAASAYSSFVGYGGNTENPPTDPAARDFGVDTTAPTGGIVNDGTGADTGYNDGSLSSLSANWSGVSSTVSGLQKYEYAIGTTAGGTDTKTWTDNTTSTSVTASSLTLRTGQTYYFTIRTTDNATNVSTPINSNGQAVAATLTFSYFSGGTITFNELNSGNSYTDSAKTTVLQTSTNAYGGYVVKARALDELRHTGNASYYIDHYAGLNSSPTTWSGTGFGYTTSDSDLSGGTGNRFTSGGPKYAGWVETVPGDPVADHTANVTGSPISSEQFTVTYRVTGSSTGPAGKYQTTLVYTCIPQY